MRGTTLLILGALALLPCGCTSTFYGKAEFAPPADRRPPTMPSAIAKDEPAPPVWMRYCYRTLAAADCFATPDPNRTGFTGIYPIPGTY